MLKKFQVEQMRNAGGEQAEQANQVKHQKNLSSSTFE